MEQHPNEKPERKQAETTDDTVQILSSALVAAGNNTSGLRPDQIRAIVGDETGFDETSIKAVLRIMGADFFRVCHDPRLGPVGMTLTGDGQYVLEDFEAFVEHLLTEEQ